MADETPPADESPEAGDSGTTDDETAPATAAGEASSSGEAATPESADAPEADAGSSDGDGDDSASAGSDGDGEASGDASDASGDDALGRAMEAANANTNPDDSALVKAAEAARAAAADSGDPLPPGATSLTPSGRARQVRPPTRARTTTTTTTRALSKYKPDPSQADRPWLLAIVDQQSTRDLVGELELRLTKRFRVAICPTVTAGLKLIEACLAVNDPIAVLLTEEPLAGMSGGGLWAMQKCRQLLPDAVRLLGVTKAEALMKASIEKLRDADVHQVFTLGLAPDQFIQQLLDPLIVREDDSVNESLRSATVRATTPVRLLKIPKETFWDLLLHDSRLSIGITRELARRLRKHQQ